MSNKEQGQGAKKKQHVSETSAQLSMDLVFDTTDTGTDVRVDTGEIVKLLSPDAKAKKAPRMVEFSWGTYSFTGLTAGTYHVSYEITSGWANTGMFRKLSD